MALSRKTATTVGIVLAAALLLSIRCGVARATPSTQIWIPSTDVQPFKTFHLNVDGFVRTDSEPSGSRLPTIYMIGPTVGVLPFQKVQAEVGFDLIYNGLIGSDGVQYDSNPVYFHAKVATPEDAWFKGSPAVAAGGYNFGTRKGSLDGTGTNYAKTGTDANIFYGLAARTLPVVGRLSVGYYGLNRKASVAGVYLDDEKGDDAGLLASWDRTMTEISDKLWLAVDYQGGDNAYGALSFGASWAFAKNVSVIAGYDVYNDKDRAGRDTFTLQVDINFP